MKRSKRSPLRGGRDDGHGAPHARSGRNVRGVLAVRRSGAAYVIPEGDDKTEIAIAPEFTANAWNGDLVEVAVLSGRPGGPGGRRGQTGRTEKGRVLAVLNRAHSEITVLVLRRARAGERLLCRPADPRIRATLLVGWDGLAVAGHSPEPGELLRVAVGERLPSPPDDPLWSGEALASLGREDDVAAQERLAKLNYGVPTEFPERVEAEALAAAALHLGPEELAGLPNTDDWRDLPLVTIDGADARDFDDAICVQKLQGGWRLVVAIADVSLYVRPNGALDKEARERGNSYYFPASVEPMLPRALSDGACSLLPGEDRRVLTADMSLDAGGALLSCRFAAGVMRSRGRLTYTAVQDFLDGKERETWERPGSMMADVAAMLEHAAALADTLIRRRALAGSLDFDAAEAEFVMENGRLKSVRRRERLFSHRLIEAFMIAANEAAAVFLEQHGAPGLYRVHPAPGAERLQGLVTALRATGLDLPMPAPARAAENAVWLPGLLESVAGTDEAPLVHRLVLRAMQQARYDPEPAPHFGLASARYCHFTSPIRRYADLTTHRAIRHALGLPVGGSLTSGRKLLAVADICNRRERVAQDAERDIARRLACLVLRERVGETFAVVISSVTHFGFFAEFAAMPVEGMARVESLGNDYFDYDPDRAELRGRRSGLAYRLGQKLNARLVDVNVGRLEINLVPEAPSAETRAARNSGGQRYEDRRRPAARRDARHGFSGRKGRRGH